MSEFNDKALYEQMMKNTVNSKNQLRESKLVKFYNLEHDRLRIMFVGNSITLHGKLSSIGWENECGMAASRKENDYVHILMDKTLKINPETAFCICQVAEWEREYTNGCAKYSLFDDARSFDANIIVFRALENCSHKNIRKDVFKKELSGLISYLNPSGKAKIILSTAFWHHPLDAAMEEFAKEKQLPLVLLGDLGEKDEMKALGLFKHDGVANHPGDLGMKNIAERIFVELEKIL